MHPYEKIRTEMLRRISNQTWAAGTLLPHEEDLAREFGVARGTVRRAMETLVDQGLVERRKKAGTRVKTRNAHSSTLSISVVRNEIEAQGGVYGYQCLSCETLPAGSKGHDFFKRAKLVEVRCLHLSDGRPYQLEDRLISLGAVPEAGETDFCDISPNEWLVERVPYSAVDTVLRAEAADALQSSHLDVAIGAPVFVITRQTQLAAKPITFVKMSHPAETFEIRTMADAAS